MIFGFNKIFHLNLSEAEEARGADEASGGVTEGDGSTEERGC